MVPVARLRGSVPGLQRAELPSRPPAGFAGARRRRRLLANPLVSEARRRASQVISSVPQGHNGKAYLSLDGMRCLREICGSWLRQNTRCGPRIERGGHGPGGRYAVFADRLMWLLSPALISRGAFTGRFCVFGYGGYSAALAGKAEGSSGRCWRRHNGDQAGLP